MTSNNGPPSMPAEDAMQRAMRAADLTPHSSQAKKSFLFLAAESERERERECQALRETDSDAVRAAERLQRWFRSVRSAQRLRARLSAPLSHSHTHRAHSAPAQLHAQHVAKILSLCAHREKGFEYAQSLLFSDVCVRACSALLQLSPALTQALTSQHRLTSVAAAVKHLSSALLISFFPEDCLYSSLSLSSAEDSLSPSPSSPPNSALLGKARACERSAQQTRAQLHRLVAEIESALSQSSTLSVARCLALDRRCALFHAALSHFLVVFREWKALDAQRMVRSLEETFSFAYATLRAAQRRGEEELALSAQQQAQRAQLTLAQLLPGGPAQAQSRVEELSAAVDLSLRAEEETVVPTVSLPQTNTQTQTHTQTQAPTEKESQIETESARQEREVEERAMRHLDALSALAGIENERLAHELTLDKHFRLPLQSNASGDETATATSVTDAKSFAAFLKKQMLAAMADKLVNSLRRSNVDRLSQLRVDMVVPLRVASVSPSAAVSVPCYSARILRMYSAASPAVSLASLDDTRPDTDTDSPAHTTEGVLLEVEYVVERSREADVSLDRVCLSHEPNDAVPLVEALRDVCESLASLTPHRADLQRQTRESFDAELLTLLLTQRFPPSHNREGGSDENDRDREGECVIDVERELWPVLQRILSMAISLQADFRVRESEQWLRVCERAFCGRRTAVGEDTDSEKERETERGAQRLLEQARRRSVSLTPLSPNEERAEQVVWKNRLEDVLPLIPLALEKIMEIVEDIQRDTANYYISLLVPVLEKHGHEFLSRRFKQRLQDRTLSLDRTAALLSYSLQTLPDTLTELREADYLPANADLSLRDLLMSSPPSADTPEMLSRGVVARAMVSLLQSPVALDSASGAQIVPETLQWDRERLAALRMLADKIALESSLTLSARQVLHFFRVAPREEEETELQHRLDALLSSSSSVPARAARSSPSEGEGKTLPQNYDLKELRIRVEKMVRDVTSEQNPVLALFSKRVFKILLRAMLGQSFAGKLASYSLQSKGQERNLSRLIDQGTKLFQHTMKVHGDIYRALLHTLASSLLANGEPGSAPPQQE